MNTRFENYEELNDFDMIDTYYDEVKDYKYFIDQLQEDRVESQKYIVNANKEINRLNNIIDELEKDLEEVFDRMKEKQVGIGGRGYYYTDLIPIEDILHKLKELKGE